MASILPFAIFDAHVGIPTVCENVFAQGEGSGEITGGDSGTTGGMIGSSSGTTDRITKGDGGMTGGDTGGTIREGS